MNISIIIPQVFYDVIARIMPGFFFCVLALLSFPEWKDYLSPLAHAGEINLAESVGHGVVYAALCYLLGWLFSAYQLGSKREDTREKHQIIAGNKSFKKMYQWIRLSHPTAGFRIVKLRAEARMFQATRTATIVVVVLAVAYVVVLLAFFSPSVWPLDRAFWLRPLLGVLIAVLSFFGFGRCEEKAWNYYWGNVLVVYDALHDDKNPVMCLAVNQKNAETGRE